MAKRIYRELNDDIKKNIRFNEGLSQKPKHRRQKKNKQEEVIINAALLE